MANRALIIAVENYPRAKGLPDNTLPGTRDAGERFRGWLLEKKGLAPENIHFCTEEGAEGRTAGTSRAEILDEVIHMVEAGRDEGTEELYVFFSGHGFSYQDRLGAAPLDVLVTGEFRSADRSGTACIRLDELQLDLWEVMGPGEHYYFIDACRNWINVKEIEVTELGLRLKDSEKARPDRCTLFSTAEGALSGVESGFPGLLIQGLQGAGTAKRWVKKQMYVTWDSLVSYLKEGLKRKGQEVKPTTDGSPRGLLFEVTPIPTFRCRVRVCGARDDDEFLLSLFIRSRKVRCFPFSGGSFAFTELPDEYELVLLCGNALVAQKRPPHGEEVVLYDNCRALFAMARPEGREVPRKLRTNREKRGAGSARVDASRPVSRRPHGRLSVTARPGTRVVLARAGAGDEHTGGEAFTGDVPAGTYQVRMLMGDSVLATASVDVVPDGETRLNLRHFTPHPVRDALLRVVPSGEEGVKFSEQIGPLPYDDPALWLSVVGASRILGPNDFPNLRDLPLERFDDVRPGAAPVYVLLGFAERPAQVHLALSRDESVQWRRVEPVEGLDPVYEARFEAGPGGWLASLAVDGSAPTTVVTYALANRATLLVLELDAVRRLSVRQFILPLRGLQQSLHAVVRDRLDQRPLRAVAFGARAQAAFASYRDIEAQAAHGLLGDEWQSLLFQKWLDPVMAVIASYELIRRGEFDSAPLVIENLRRYFYLPDVEVLARRAGAETHQPDWPPLVLDGLLALRGTEEWPALPLPESALDFRGPWTTWVGAVPPPTAGPKPTLR